MSMRPAPDDLVPWALARLSLVQDDVTGQTHQIWYDDPISLKLRYFSAREKKLRGVAAFRADCLDYSTKQRAVNETNAMWDAFIGY